MKRRTTFLGIASVLVGGLLTPAAVADMETHTCDFAIDLYYSTGETSVTIPMFDRPAGQYQLDSVHIRMTGGLYFELAVENMTYPPMPVSGVVGYDAFVQAEHLSVAQCFAHLPIDLASPDGNPRSGPDYYYYSPSMWSIFEAFGDDETTSWEGSGNRDVLIRATKQWYDDLEPPASVAVYQDPIGPHINGTLTVEYSYSFIPEPTTLLLLAISGLAMLRRKR